MNNYISTYIQLILTLKLNNLIYKIRSIKIFNKIIPSDIYKSVLLNGGFTALSYFAYIIKTILKKVIYCLFVLLIANKIVGGIKENPLNFNVLVALFYIGVVLAVVIHHFTYISYDQTDSICIKSLKLNTKKYMMIMDYIQDCEFIITGISLAIMFKILDINPIYALNYTAFNLGIRKISKYLAVALYKTNHKKHYTKNYVFIGLWVALGFAISFVGIFKMNFLIEIFYSYYALALGIVAYIIGDILIRKTDKIEKISKLEITNQSIIDSEIDLNEIDALPYKIDDEKISTTDTKIFEEYSGIQYINKIFRYRFHQKYKKTILIKSIIVAIVGVAIAVLLKSMPLNISDENTHLIWKIFPIFLLYIFGLISISESFNRFIFINLDRYLMKQMIYKKDDTVRQTLKIRIRQNLHDNFIQMVLVLISLLSWVTIEHVLTPMNFAKILITVLILYVFSSVKNLYLYFLIQPFTVGLKSKKYSYNILTSFETLLFWGLVFSQIKLKNQNIGILVLIIAVIYIVVGYIITMKKAPRTFRLRRE